MTQLMETVFQNEMTENGLAELRKRYPSNLVMDMTVDDEFKKARKIRTERNKLVYSIDQRRKDVNSEIKDHGDALIEKVNTIFDVVVEPFEAEDKRRKIEAERIKKEEEFKVAEARKQVAAIEDFIKQCQGRDSDYIADMIESVDLIDVDTIHKDVIHEAIEVKKTTLSTLTQMLSDVKAREKLAAEEAKLAEERRKMEAEKAEFEAWKRQKAEEEAKAQREAEQKAASEREEAAKAAESKPAQQKAEQIESEESQWQGEVEHEAKEIQQEAAPTAKYLGHPSKKKPENTPRKLSMIEINGIINFVSSITSNEQSQFADELQRRADDYIQKHSAKVA